MGTAPSDHQVSAHKCQDEHRRPPRIRIRPFIEVHVEICIGPRSVQQAEQGPCDVPVTRANQFVDGPYYWAARLGIKLVEYPSPQAQRHYEGDEDQGIVDGIEDTGRQQGAQQHEGVGR